jgi:hypothetical protein
MPSTVAAMASGLAWVSGLASVVESAMALGLAWAWVLGLAWI